MTDSDFPLQMEALIEDSIEQIISHEDSQHFIGWMREHIDDYYTGPDLRQGGLFGESAVANPNQVILEPDMLRALAVNLAGMIWNSTPLPSNHFKLRPMPLPKRNDPCHCGSGKKYKQCCARLPATPALSTDEIWPILFEKLDKETAARAIRENHVPINALSTMAYEHLESNQPKKAAALPLFDGNIRKTNDDAEYALTLLCNTYDELGHNKKKTTLLQNIIDTVPRSPLRSGAWQRLSTIRIDNGDANGAWAAFQNAQRDDPKSMSLGLLEVQILNAQGRNEKARQRADFWVRQMRRAGVPDDDMPLAFLIEVARDPVEAFADFGLESVDDAGLLLKQWLEEVQDRPLPKYTICNEMPPTDLDEGVGMKTLRKQLSSYGMDEDQIEQALQEMKNKSGEIRDDVEEEDLEDGDFLPETDGKSLQPPAKLAKLERDWHRIYPLNKPFSVHETPHEEEDPWDVFEELEWASWLQDHPAAFDSLDILDDLATALMMHPQFGTPWLNETLLIPLLQRSEAITEKALAAADEPQLHWVMPDNRPALRAMARLVNIKAIMDGKQEEALPRAQRLITINPHDNHGFRSIVINQLIIEGRDEEALQLAQEFPGDMNPDVTFGKVLVLYRLGRQKEAVEEVGNALEFLGKIPRYLTAKRIRKPKLHPDGVMYGGDDQAWYYREEMRDAWLQTPGVLEWLKNAEKAFR
jgi:Flp pilus assembly protein TadD